MVEVDIILHYVLGKVTDLVADRNGGGFAKSKEEQELQRACWKMQEELKKKE